MQRSKFRGILVASIAALIPLAHPANIQKLKTKHVILLTSDGLRWQDLFGGMDPLLMNEKSAGMAEAGPLRKQLWRDTPSERRKALMPFFWSTIASKGVIFGNVNAGSSVEVTNRYRVSYPGYSEILTGRAQDEAIRGNDDIQNPTPTILDFIRRKKNLKPRDVALFASWETFNFIGTNKPGDVFINAGLSELKLPSLSPHMAGMSAGQFHARTPWDGARHDYFTFELAFDYLEKVHPHLMYIAFDETDDWAHDRRYDRVLEQIAYFDQCLQRVWEWVQSSREYRNSTTLVITSDHGRGGTVNDWHAHGPKVKGDEQIWIAVMGPDTPATGEAGNTPRFYQRDVAPTILSLLGIDYHDYAGVAGQPIPPAIRH